MIPKQTILALAVVSLCAGCGASGRDASGWNGRRGYDGAGDYGYSHRGSQAEADDYRALASRAYPVPGTPDDPWGPYVIEAATRFDVPERWVRAVMRQESGGHEYDADGAPITSAAGAMGLMQVMPRTYDLLRAQYGLGGDPYDPRDNILAGAAYIRQMYDRYGSPNFLAAYNAGPERLEAALAGASPLPDETVAYLASVGPLLGTGGALVGTGGASLAAGVAVGTPVADDPSLHAFDGGGLVTPGAPTGVLTGVLTPTRPAVPSADVVPGREASAAMPGAWAIQVGAYADPRTSAAAIAAARSHVTDLLGDAAPDVEPVQRGRLLYRARLVGLSAAAASGACARLASAGVDCIPVPPGT